MLNPSHYSQNIGLIKYCILWKYAWKILNCCLLQWCYFFVHMLRYFAGLNVFCFPNFSFLLPWHRLWWIHHECLRFSVDKSPPTVKRSTCKVVCFLIRPFVSIYTLTRLQIIQIAVENQCKKKACGNPLRTRNLPF